MKLLNTTDFNTNMIRRLVLAAGISSASALLVACGGGEPASSDYEATPEATTQTEAAPAEAAPSVEAEPEVVHTRDTAEGTVNLFVTALAEKRFMDAAELCDPNHDGYENLIATASAIERMKTNPELAMGVGMLSSMSDYLVGASINEVAVTANRAQYLIDPAEGLYEAVEINLEEREGVWLVLAPARILQPNPSTVPAPRQAPAGPPVPRG